MSSTGLPEGTHLAYIVSHQAWYAKTPGIVDGRQVEVMASAKGQGGGVAWAFTVEEVELVNRRPAIRVKVFDDAFAAFTEIPEFFASLAEHEGTALGDVVAALDGMGAADETDRKGPDGKTTGQATAERIQKAIYDVTGVPAAAAAQAVMRVLGAEHDPR